MNYTTILCKTLLDISDYIVCDTHINNVIFTYIVKKVLSLRICTLVIFGFHFCQEILCYFIKISNASSIFC